jgi:hypothetical protein
VASRLLFLLSERDPVFGRQEELGRTLIIRCKRYRKMVSPSIAAAISPIRALIGYERYGSPVTWSLCFVDLWILVSPPMVPHSQTRGAANASLTVLVLPKGRYDTRHINAIVQIRISSDDVGGQWDRMALILDENLFDCP